jgi:hypothetical protein
MGRTVRRVPANWEHPKYGYGTRPNDYKPLHYGFKKDLEEFEEMLREKGAREATDYYGGAPYSRTTWTPIGKRVLPPTIKCTRRYPKVRLFHRRSLRLKNWHDTCHRTVTFGIRGEAALLLVMRHGFAFATVGMHSLLCTHQPEALCRG